MPADKRVISLKSAIRAGKELLADGRYDAARRGFSLIVRQRPANAAAHAGRGEAFLGLGEARAARRSFRRALILNPASAGAHANMAVIWSRYAPTGPGEALIRRALLIEPGNVDMHVCLALILLQSGRWAEGWREYEHRRVATQAFADCARAGIAPWIEGDHPPGPGPLLLLPEQGAGDTIQFLRYLRVLRDRGIETVFAGPPEMARLAVHASGYDRGAADGHHAGRSVCMLMGLPHRLQHGVAEVPAPAPYLTHPPAGFVLTRTGRLRVGIVWAGNPAHSGDRHRSCPWEALKPIFGVANVDFHALQKEPRLSPEQMAELAELAVPLYPAMADFPATAALIAQMDLVISVDTAAAHLAGALNIPVWLLVGQRPDWRWLLNRDDTIWYPGARLFRARPRESWDGLIARVTQALDRLAGA